MAAVTNALAVVQSAGLSAPIKVRPAKASQNKCPRRVKGPACPARQVYAMSSQDNTGFTEADSAGQSNVFAVEPKIYEAGSKADKTEGTNPLIALGIGAVCLGGAVVVLMNGGAASNSPTKASLPTPDLNIVSTKGLKTISAYAEEFIQDISAPGV
eukprot:jgi/Mesvir1/13159/Mv06126-RA.1